MASATADGAQVTATGLFRAADQAQYESKRRQNRTATVAAAST